MTKAEKRKINYNLLIEAGFNSKEARRLRDLSKDRLLNEISQMKKEEKIVPFKTDIIKDKFVSTPKKRRNYIKYKDIKEVEKGYLSNYTYIVSYERVERRGIKIIHREREYITITSGSQKYFTKREVLEKAREIVFNENPSFYKSMEILKTSFRLEDAIKK